MSKKDDFWLDDPEWDLLRRRAEKHPVPKELKRRAKDYARPEPPKKSKEQSPKNVSDKEDKQKEVVVNVKLAIPKIKLPDFRRFYSVHRRKVWTGGVTAAVLVIGLVSFQPLTDDKAGEVAGTSNNPSESAQDEAQANFNPLIPLENLKDDSGKQSVPEFRYDKEKQVLGYTSEYNQSTLTVSQQKLPEDLKQDPGKLATIALSFGGEKLLETQKGTAYVATDEKSKAQTAIFATKEVLVFVRSNKTLDEDEWTFYINQLNPRQ